VQYTHGNVSNRTYIYSETILSLDSLRIGYVQTPPSPASCRVSHELAACNQLRPKLKDCNAYGMLKSFRACMSRTDDREIVNWLHMAGIKETTWT
jgi:hypothetical protein